MYRKQKIIKICGFNRYIFGCVYFLFLRMYVFVLSQKGILDYQEMGEIV